MMLAAMPGLGHQVHQAVEDQGLGHDQGQVQGPVLKGPDQGLGIGRGGVVGPGRKSTGQFIFSAQAGMAGVPRTTTPAIGAGIELAGGPAGLQGGQQGPAVGAHKADFLLFIFLLLRKRREFFCIIYYLRRANPSKTIRRLSGRSAAAPWPA